MIPLGQFLKQDNIQLLLEQNNLNEIYWELIKKASRSSEVSDLTNFLIKIGINPLDYMSFVVPWMFAGLEIQNIEISENINEINEYAFGFCHNLKEVIIPNSVHSIGIRAFTHCPSLIYVTLPNNLKVMEVSVVKDSPNVIIRCGEGTLGELYAKENKIPYELI